MSELCKKRIQVTLNFDVTVDDDKIEQSGNSEEVQGFDLALLRQFLQADESRIQELLTYQVALYMGWCCIEDMEKWLVGKEMGHGWEHHIFGPAINSLPGSEGDYWRETRDTHGVLSQCTEKIFECFDTKYVSSNVEVVEENDGSS